MSGFFDAGASGVIGTSVAALVTIAVWSYLAGERRLFAAAQHLLAGLATGYFVLISVREVLVPRLFVPLFGNPDAHPLLWPALLGVLVLIGARWMPRRVAALPIALLIADTSDPAQLRHVLPQLATGKLVLLGYLAFSCGQAAFPSCGDHVGVLGALALTAILGITVAVILSNGGRAELTTVLRDACLLLAVPAIASALSLLVLGTIARARRST